MSDSLYPPNVTGVPPDLTRPSEQYRRSVTIAILSLLLFFGFYLALTGAAAWMFWKAVTLPSEGEGDVVGRVVLGIPTGFILLFFLKGFFKRHRSEEDVSFEIHREEEPELFAFIDRVCSDVGAPQPRKVVLDPDVNASVSFNTSILNLVLPIKKDLHIGLGLVNTLTLSEFKEVIAHEFGHFSQSSLRLGVYFSIIHRVIHDLVYSRDVWDRALQVWTRIGDLRISAAGWVIYAAVWVLRKILESSYGLIGKGVSALMREQEYHADLVAASLCGSDSGVTGSRRMELGLACLQVAMNDLRTAADQKLHTRDLFYHQTAAEDHVRRLADNPQFGIPPPLPDDVTQPPVVFKEEEGKEAGPYDTHPTNFQRQQNLTQIYLRSPVDERSPWLLFRDAQAVRERMTRLFYEKVVGLTDPPQLSDPETVQAYLENERLHSIRNNAYYGLYDQRLLQLPDLRASVAAVQAAPWTVERLLAVHQQLYGGQLQTWMEAHRKRLEEYSLLSALQEGQLQLKGKHFEFREVKRQRREIPTILAEVQSELSSDDRYFESLDESVFLAHYQMAGMLRDDSHITLWRYYEFLVPAQEVFETLLTEFQRIESVIAVAQSEESSISDKDVIEMLKKGQWEVENALRKSQALVIPEMRNFEAGQVLSTYLAPAPFPEWVTHKGAIDSDRFGEYYQSLASIRERMARVHSRCIDAMLAVQETIAAEWLSRFNPLVREHKTQ